jgi:hypothetical protein
VDVTFAVEQATPSRFSADALGVHVNVVAAVTAVIVVEFSSAPSVMVTTESPLTVAIETVAYRTALVPDEM